MEARHVSLLVGKRSYNIRTSLDEETLKDVYTILHDAVAETDPAMDQDERLFLAGIMLANELSMLAGQVDRMSSLIGRQPSFWRIEPADSGEAEA